MSSCRISILTINVFLFSVIGCKGFINCIESRSLVVDSPCLLDKDQIFLIITTSFWMRYFCRLHCDWNQQAVNVMSLFSIPYYLICTVISCSCVRYIYLFLFFKDSMLLGSIFLKVFTGLYFFTYAFNNCPFFLRPAHPTQCLAPAFSPEW